MNDKVNQKDTENEIAVANNATATNSINDKNLNSKLIKKINEKDFNQYEKYRTSHELILIPKLEDLTNYIFQILIKIPRVDKFNIGNELKTSCLEMLKWSYFVSTDRKNSLAYLNRIDANKSFSKALIRILYSSKSITDKNYRTAILKLDEIGKIIGGLIKVNRNEIAK